MVEMTVVMTVSLKVELMVASMGCGLVALRDF
jgi:hypothetical protein